MKAHLLLCAGMLLLALPPRRECRALGRSPGAARGAPQQPDFFPQRPQPVLLRLGEEYLLRLGGRPEPRAGPVSASSRGRPRPGASAESSRAAPRRPGSAEESEAEGGEPAEREKRSEEPPISLDLTFHLLREVLEMARAEQLAQQAHSNRKLMEIIGK